MAKTNVVKKVFNMAYGLGASVVILGALFKLMHWKGGGPMLVAGMVVEALLFAASAFEPVEEDLDWSLVYPELVGGKRVMSGVGETEETEETEEAERLLSKKLDDLLRDAKIDTALMESLGESIRSFEETAKNMGPTMDTIEATKKYGEEVSMAATQMESLNGLYRVQLEDADKQTEINKEVAEHSLQLKEQIVGLTSNLSTLNNVYGGMLSAMNTRSN